MKKFLFVLLLPVVSVATAGDSALNCKCINGRPVYYMQSTKQYTAEVTAQAKLRNAAIERLKAKFPTASPSQIQYLAALQVDQCK